MQNDPRLAARMKALLDNRIGANVTAMVISGGLANSISKAAQAGKLGRISSSIKSDGSVSTNHPAREVGQQNSPSANSPSISHELLTVGEYQYTRTAGNHATDIVMRGEYKGELARPYLTSLQTIKEIIATGNSIPDPGGIPGAIKYDVKGRFRGVSGTWELVLNPDTKIIYHFNFIRG